jgi:hypothetical protein
VSHDSFAFQYLKDSEAKRGAPNPSPRQRYPDKAIFLSLCSTLALANQIVLFLKELFDKPIGFLPLVQGRS